MRFGVREICEVTFRPLAAMDIGSQHFEKNQPCLFIDTATASNMEVATTTVYAQGGRGNARLIAWEGEKTATFTVTDALLSPISFAMLSGAGVIDKTAGDKIIHTTFEGTVVNGSGSTKDKIVVKSADLTGYTPIIANGKLADGTTYEYENYKLYAMILDSEQSSVVDYIGTNEIASIAFDSSKNLEITLKVTGGSYPDHTVRVDCYSVTTKAAVTTLTVDADNFGGTFYIEAETLFRDEATGQDFPATFVIPKGKIQGNFTFNMASTGDPSTFDFKIDCTIGSVRGLPGRKVLYAIDIIDNISSSELHDDTTNKDATTDTVTYKTAATSA